MYRCCALACGMSPTKMMSGFRLPDLLALRFLALCGQKRLTLGRAYEEALKMWCDAQEGIEAVKAAEAEKKKLEPIAKPEPVTFVSRRPPPEWKVYGFKHGLAHLEAKRGGWKVGDPIPEGLAAPVVVSPAPAPAPESPAPAPAPESLESKETRGASTEALSNVEDFA